MKTKINIGKYLTIFLGIIIIDIVSKIILQNANYSIIPNFFEIKTMYNTGIAFSFLTGYSFILIFLITAVLCYVSYLWYKASSEHYKIALTIVFSGGLANLLERIFFGRITDFIAFSFWPAFNVADSAVSIGIIYLLILSIKKEKF